MRYIKRKILENLKEFENINSQLKDISKKGKVFENIDEILDILTYFQTVAAKIGTYFENNEELKDDIVKILESYCDNLYFQGSNLNNPEELVKISLSVQNQLEIMTEIVKTQMKDYKKQAVFLPYNLSMWDSLESIYMEAKKDKEFDVYVIPIPYYDKKPDGSFADMHYEGNEYPENIIVTDWKDYDISMEKPDIIFIHNPYDNLNYVTSVDPKFYSSNLKKYTKKLVYVPYFTSINGDIRKGLCTSIVPLIADNTVVDSEESKKIFVDELEKLAEETGNKGKFGDFNKKVVALGSPKIDKVKNTLIENIKIPEGWKKYVFDKNQNKKKIILYNTTIKAMLDKNGEFFDKIEDVIDYFKQNKDVTLLWRPHPLLVSTIKSLRPEFLDRYLNIVEKYIKQECGIFDNTADLHRAIVLSDGYYGDFSSVLELYKATGKPILIQNINMIYSGKENG